MVNEKNYEPPLPSLGDAAHAIARAGLSFIPVVGGPAVELLNTIVMPPLQRRREKWMRDVGEALQRLEAHGKVRLDGLSTNDDFVDTAVRATMTALRTSQEEKRAALRNAVLNAALPTAPDQAVQEMFVRWVEELTVWHLRILKLFQDPRAWAERKDIQYSGSMSTSLAQILETGLPQLRGRREFYDQVWNELHQRGLVNTSKLQGMMTAEGALERRTTEIGDAFLRFISEP